MKVMRILRYLFFSGIRSVRQSWGLQLVSAATVSVAFFVLAVGILVFQNLRTAILESKSGPVVLVYFSRDIPKEQKNLIAKDYCGRDFVESCNWIPASQAQKEFLRKNPGLTHTLQTLGQNPFPASLEMELDREYRDMRVIREMAQSLRKQRNIEAVDDGGEWLDRWVFLLTWMDRVLLGLGGIFCLAMVFVISNTINLVVYARRNEVEILNLVGASDMMIRIPFVVEGAFQGLLGSLSGVFLLQLVYIYLEAHVVPHWESFFLNKPEFLDWSVLVILPAAGGAIGIIGSLFAVNRFLRISSRV